MKKTAIASITAIASLALVALALVFGYKALSKTVGKLLSKTAGIADAFRSGKITMTFRTDLLKTASTHGDVLELATCDSDEYFKKEDERYLFGKVYMGTTTAEVHARCAFRYHLRLSEPWTLDVKDNVCIVRPPPYRPTLPVAIRTDMTTKSASSGWARFDKHEQMAGLEASMTPELEKRAYDDRHMGAVREHCRQSVGEFVKNWLMREDHWKKERFTAIVVEFPDEVGRGAKHRPNEFAPVIKLIE